MEAIQNQTNLEQLFRDAANDLARYFVRRHGSIETSQDLVQETFMEMAKGLQKGTCPDSPRGYLFGIARRVSQAAWKIRDKERAMTASEPSVESLATPPADDRIDAAYEVIASLSPLHREILDLRFSQQLSYAEIATAIGVPVGTVRSRIHHAVATVRERLADGDISSSSESP